MWRVNMREKSINRIKKTNRGNKSRIKIGNQHTKPIIICQDLKQGCTSSPFLFNMYIDQCLESYYSKCSGMGSSDTRLRSGKHGFHYEELERGIWDAEYMCIGGAAENLEKDGQDVKLCPIFK